jgi:hypothetical protein
VIAMRGLRLLLIGAAITTAIVLVGRSRMATLEERERALVAECSTEHLRVPANAPPWEKDPLRCDWISIVTSDAASRTPIQRDILAANADAESWKDGTTFAAIVVFIVTAAPFAWYFVLARLSELSRAIRGG